MKKEDLMETPLSREDIFHGRIFDVHKDRVALPDGRESTREVVHHKTGGVCVVPLTEDGKVYVVRQCRYPYHTTSSPRSPPASWIPARPRKNAAAGSFWKK